MRKIMYVVAGLVALAPLTLAGAAQAAPANAPSPQTEAYAQPEANFPGSTECDRGGILFACAVGYTDFQLTGNELIVRTPPGGVVPPDNGKCLYYNASGSNFDFKACDSTKTSDQWGFGNTSHYYSVWQTLYDTTICVWYEGNGNRLQPLHCSGSNSSDRWAWTADGEV